MNKSSYLADHDVTRFCQWFAATLVTASPVITQVRPVGGPLTFNGLPDALAQYDWPFTVTLPGSAVAVNGRTYSDSAGVLGQLATGINGALTSGDEQAICDWCIAIMQWGGVTAHNAAWLAAHLHGLHRHVTTHREVLAADNDDLATLMAGISRFNAGMSKVYSLILPAFIIYDSRVAGALAWFVCEWCDSAVPPALTFACLPAREAPDAERPKRRNPCDHFFPWVHGRRHVHAHWNLRAGWVLQESLRLAALATPANAFAVSAQPLRALEAALFMWGYHVPDCAKCPSEDEPTESDVDDTPAPILNREGFHTDITRGGKRKPFWWKIDAVSDRWIIEKADGVVAEFSTADIFLVIHQLYDEFGYEWVPLANNVEKLANGTETRGFGRILLDGGHSMSHAQAASQLGVVLERLHILEWNGKVKGICWRLALEPPPEIEHLRMILP